MDYCNAPMFIFL